MNVIIRNKEDLKRAKQDYDALHDAWMKALLAQSYTQGPDQVTRASIDKLQEQMSAYQTAIAAYESNGSTKRRSGRFVPLG